ncbi:MAG: alpha/beta hydrolase [Candidatus Omnitrophota bacterium]
MRTRKLGLLFLLPLLAVIISLMTSANGFAAAPEPGKELLWPGGAPGATGGGDLDKPTLWIYQPDESMRNGASVVICPGGGYRGIAIDHEGHQVAKWLNENGVTAFILTYRKAPEYHHPAPMQDVQRAIRTVRARAQEWKIDPQRIGVLGFSAGGHLASTAATHFDAGDKNAADSIERASCRPDFAVLVYPVISFTTEYAHVGSRNNLLGENPDPERVKQFSNELQVTPETPPAFLIHTTEDSGVPAENSILFYLAMRKAGVSAEMHIFEKGKHGFGLGPNDPVLSQWPKLCIDWMKQRGMLEK